MAKNEFSPSFRLPSFRLSSFKYFASMYFFKHIFLILLLFLLSLQSCTSSIKHIKKNADRFQGKKVSVSGEVISSLDLLEINCFTLKDRSGNILIVTDNLLPLKRDKIKVKGTFEKAYHYKKQSFMVLIEKKMKLQKPKKSGKIRAKTF